MDADRSQIVDPNISTWNAWLLDAAVELTFDLLTSDWIKRFGPDALLILKGRTQPATSYYIHNVERHLKEKDCWPTRAKKQGTRNRIVFACATDVVVAEPPALDGFLSDKNYLHSEFSRNSEVRNLARQNGAKVFSGNSLVRLRCAGEEHSHLRTSLKPDVEANFYYSDFPKALESEDLQLKYARVLDSLGRLLRENLDDLKSSPTTLTASGGLGAPAAPLWLVPHAILSVCPVPKSQQLHPSLAQSKTIRKLCREFDPAAWARDVVDRIEKGEASEDERLALYKYVLSVHGRLNRATQTVLRKRPTILDSRGAWVPPAWITLKRAFGADELAEVLHFPHADYAKDTQIARSLRFKQKISGEDLVKYANAVSSKPELASNFEESLQRVKRLLTPTVREKLKTIAFLQSSQGDLLRPTDLYLDNYLNKACLHVNAPFVSGSRTGLYKLLGCMEQPRARDIVDYVGELNKTGSKPAYPEVLYRALADALMREQQLPNYYEHHPILWTGTQYSCPAHTLLGAQHRRVFLQAVPQVNLSDSLRKLYGALGARTQPQVEHWRELFLWFGNRYEQTDRPVSRDERTALREAYSRLLEIPGGVPANTKCLLDREGKLHSQLDAINGHYVIDDDPELSSSVANRQSIPISFADISDERTLRFYTKIGVRSLTEIKELVETQVGENRQPPKWFKESRVLEKIHSPDFVSALVTLTAHEFRRDAGEAHVDRSRAAKQLKALESVLFVQELNAVYKLAGTDVSAPAEILLDENRIVFSRMRSYSELYGFLALAIAGFLTKSIADRRTLTDAIYRLLMSDSPNEMRTYLKSRGIPWKPAIDETDEDETDSEYIESEQEARMIQEILVEELTKGAIPQKGQVLSISQAAPPKSANRDSRETASSSPTPSLPPLESVTPQLIAPLDSWSPSEPRKGGDTRIRAWQPPTQRDQERDRIIGRRGEEIIYHQELNRMKSLGHSQSRVVWLSEDDPGADCDILTVDDDGGDLWIEVKATTGRDGRFQWSKAEFEKAIRERNRYVLWRVYEADTETPSIKQFRDPVAILLSRGMRLDIASLHAEVEPLDHR